MTSDAKRATSGGTTKDENIPNLKEDNVPVREREGDISVRSSVVVVAIRFGLGALFSKSVSERIGPDEKGWPCG